MSNKFLIHSDVMVSALVAYATPRTAAEAEVMKEDFIAGWNAAAEVAEDNKRTAEAFNAQHLTRPTAALFSPDELALLLACVENAIAVGSKASGPKVSVATIRDNIMDVKALCHRLNTMFEEAVK